MKEIMSEEDSDFYHVDRETAQFIKEMTGVNIEIQEGEEDILAIVECEPEDIEQVRKQL